MRPLRTCDFCDADAIGTFEVVPAELEPSENEQRRVLLCESCRDHLETLLEPLLDRVLGGEQTRASAAAAADPARPRSAGATETDAGSETDAITEDAITFDATTAAGEPDPDGSTPPGTDSSTASRSGSSDDDSDEPEASAEHVAESAPKQAAETDTDDTPDSSADGVADNEAELLEQRDESPAEDDAEPASDGRDDRQETESTEPTPENGGDVDGNADGTATQSATGSATRPPRAYGKVVRLLRNREFPMERDAVEQLAAGAYDLEDDDTEAIVDHAIANDEFDERGDKLHRS